MRKSLSKTIPAKSVKARIIHWQPESADAERTMRTHLHNAKTVLEHAVVEEDGGGPSQTKPESKRCRVCSCAAMPDFRPAP